jgi:PAS domain S-box-containing protein
MLTGQGSEKVAVQALKLGAQDYLIKDRAAEYLRYTVHAVIEKVALFRRIKEQRRELERVAWALRENEERYRLLGSRMLREGEERYRLLVEDLVDYAIVMLDAEGRIVSWNAGAERLLGYRAEEVIGKDVSCLYAPGAARPCQPHRELQRAAGAGRSVIEAEQLRKDGSRFLAQLIITALRDQSGTLWGFAQVAREVTETARDAG